MRAAPEPPTGTDRRESLGSALLLLGVVALAGEVAIFRVYSPDGLLRLVLLALAALAGVLLGGSRRRPPSWAIVVAALLSVRALATAPPLSDVDSDSRLLTGVLVVTAATAVPALLPVVRTAHAGLVTVHALAAAAAGYSLVVLGSRPLIDVWVLLQAAGRGLAAGRNPYDMAFPAAPPGQVDDCFTYLPGSVLLTSPGVWLGGDARWAEMLLLIASSAMVAWQVHRRGGARLGLAAFVALVPGSLVVVQQAWTEPLLLAALVATAVLLDRGRSLWAAVAFGLALATKQHIVLLLPLLLVWRWRARDLAVAAAVAAGATVPFLLANPARFTGCTAGFFLTAPPPPSSLSLWLHVPTWAQLPLLVTGLVAGYAIAWRCPRDGSGLLLAAAVVFTTVGLVNKQTFLNQWWLVAALVAAGLAMTGGRAAAARPSDRSVSAFPDGVSADS